MKYLNVIASEADEGSLDLYYTYMYRYNFFFSLFLSTHLYKRFSSPSPQWDLFYSQRHVCYVTLFLFCPPSVLRQQYIFSDLFVSRVSLRRLFQAKYVLQALLVDNLHEREGSGVRQMLKNQWIENGLRNKLYAMLIFRYE